MKNHILRGIVLFILGISVTILHQCKIVPTGWEDSSFLTAITGAWAYTGLFIGIGLIVGGLYYLGFVDWLMNKMQD